jgi:hypothetical protein
MTADLLYGEEIDRRLNWHLGKAVRLAKRGKLPYVVLPDGSIRFRWEEISLLLVERPGAAEASP